MNVVDRGPLVDPQWFRFEPASLAPGIAAAFSNRLGAPIMGCFYYQPPDDDWWNTGIVAQIGGRPEIICLTWEPNRNRWPDSLPPTGLGSRQIRNTPIGALHSRVLAHLTSESLAAVKAHFDWLTSDDH